MMPTEIAVTLLGMSGAIIVALIAAILAFWRLKANGSKSNPGNDRFVKFLELSIEREQGLIHYLEGMENRAQQRHEAIMNEIGEMFNVLAPRRGP